MSHSHHGNQLWGVVIDLQCTSCRNAAGLTSMQLQRAHQTFTVVDRAVDCAQPVAWPGGCRGVHAPGRLDVLSGSCMTVRHGICGGSLDAILALLDCCADWGHERLAVTPYVMEIGHQDDSSRIGDPGFVASLHYGHAFKCKEMLTESLDLNNTDPASCGAGEGLAPFFTMSLSRVVPIHSQCTAMHACLSWL